MRRKFVMLNSKASRDDLEVDLAPRWLKEVSPLIGEGCCRTINKVVDTLPETVYLTARPKFHFTAMIGHPILVVSKQFYECVHPHASAMSKLIVEYETSHGLALCTSHLALFTKPVDAVNVDRGKEAMFWTCDRCGSVAYAYGRGDTVVESTVPPPPFGFFGTNHMLPIIDRDLYRSLCLREKFPELRARAMRVVEVPENVQVLPGDPGWTGKLAEPWGTRRERDEWIYQREQQGKNKPS